MHTPIKQEDKREYTIKIIPHQGETVHSARLPIKAIKYGLAAVSTVAVLFVGAFSYAAYGMFSIHRDEAEVQELRQVNTMQQEQLLQLAKKANKLQDDMEKLNQFEQELRQITAIDPKAAEQTVETSESGHDGQGGPYVKPNFKNVNEALDVLAKQVEKKRLSLESLKEKVREQQEYIAYQNSVNACIPSIWPSSGEVSSPYGLRWGGTDFHPGIDIADDFGTPIVAAADGLVVEAGWNSGGYGNMVDIDHGNGILTRYGHAQAVVVSAGQHVKKGQIIAYMGSTGYSTGPHLHYEVQVNGQAVNPASYL